MCDAILYDVVFRTGERKAVRELASARGNVQVAAHFIFIRDMTLYMRTCSVSYIYEIYET